MLLTLTLLLVLLLSLLLGLSLLGLLRLLLGLSLLLWYGLIEREGVILLLRWVAGGIITTHQIEVQNVVIIASSGLRLLLLSTMRLLLSGLSSRDLSFGTRFGQFGGFLFERLLGLYVYFWFFLLGLAFLISTIRWFIIFAVSVFVDG